MIVRLLLINKPTLQFNKIMQIIFYIHKHSFSDVVDADENEIVMLINKRSKSKQLIHVKRAGCSQSFKAIFFSF